MGKRSPGRDVPELPVCSLEPSELHILETRSIREFYVNTAVVITLADNSLQNSQRADMSISPVSPMPSTEGGRGGQGLLIIVITVLY